jgi:hypothetical protein
MTRRIQFALLPLAALLCGCPAGITVGSLDLDVTEIELAAAQATEPVPDIFRWDSRDQFDVSSCGDVGSTFLMEDAGGGIDAVFVAADGSTEVLGDGVSEFPAPSLAFDADCAPHVLLRDSDTYRHWTDDGTGWAELALLELDVGGAWVSNHVGLTLGQDGSLHLVATIDVTGVVHATWDGSSWSAVQMDYFDTSAEVFGVFGVEVDAAGDLHVLYSLERHLYYAVGSGTSFTTQAVKERANFDNEPGLDADLALDDDGKPWIAATEAQRVTTGSFQWMRLVWYAPKDGGGWDRTVLVADSDGFAGGDGLNYTGQNPSLAFDGDGVAHLAYTDLASWHNESNWNDTTTGNLRYLRWDGSEWLGATLYEQPGQTESDNPLHETIQPQLRVLDDGTVDIFAIERITDGFTVTYDTDPISEHRVLLFEAR